MGKPLNGESVLIRKIVKRRFIMRNLILFLVFSSTIFSQDVYAYAQDDVEYPEFRVLLETGEWIEGRDGYFTSSFFNGILKNGEEISISKNVVSAIQVPSGSMAGQGALIGAGTGFLISSIIHSWASKPVSTPSRDIMMAGLIIPVTIGAIGIPTLLGGIIGANKAKWEEIPVKTSFMFDPQERGAMFAVSIQF